MPPLRGLTGLRACRCYKYAAPTGLDGASGLPVLQICRPYGAWIGASPKSVIIRKSDFYYFVEQPHELPNIHGQDDCSPLRNWIEQWSQRNLSFKSLLENNFNILFCKGASNTCFPSRHEEKNVIKALKQARDYGYEIDNDLIKQFKSKYGNIRELRSYQDGVRIFFALREDVPIIGGFYRKSTAISQNKAGEYAAKRLKDQGYL